MRDEPLVYVVVADADGNRYFNDCGRPVVVAFTKDRAGSLQRSWRGNVPRFLPLRLPNLDVLPH